MGTNPVRQGREEGCMKGSANAFGHLVVRRTLARFGVVDRGIYRDSWCPDACGLFPSRLVISCWVAERRKLAILLYLHVPALALTPLHCCHRRPVDDCCIEPECLPPGLIRVLCIRRPSR